MRQRGRQIKTVSAGGEDEPTDFIISPRKGGYGSDDGGHTAIALAASGHRVAALDLDSRQRTMTRYFENRDATIRRVDKDLPQVRFEVLEELSEVSLDAALERLSEDTDVIVLDTPGRDDPVARAAILKADTLVTPMNDSFVDLDLIGQVHPENYKITKPSFYGELIWNAAQRAKEAPQRDGSSAHRLTVVTSTSPRVGARSTNWPAASASASFRASASASSTANCSPRA